MPEISEAASQDDPELRSMTVVFTALKSLDSDAQVRVLEYVERRLGLIRHLPSKPHRGAEEEPSPTTVREDRTHSISIHDSESSNIDSSTEDHDTGELEGISPIAQKWMRRNGITPSQMSILYSLGVDEIDLVATKVPGESVREKLRHIILLQGIAAYLSSGAARVDDGKLTEAMRHYNADPGRNFSKYLKSWASEVSGSKSSGLSLTARGMNSARDLIKQMTPTSGADI